MKICLINNLYKPYSRGGAERIVETVAEGLKKAGHKVFVVSTQPIKGVQPPIGVWTPKLYTFYPWNIISYYNLSKLPKFIRPLWHLINIFNIQSYFKIKKILRAEKPDIVMTHNLMGVGFLTPLAIKKCGIKHIHTLHDIQLLHPSGLMFVNKENKINSVFAKIYQAINKKLFSKIDIVISPSKWLMQMHVKQEFFGKAKRVVLQNPVQNSEFRNKNLENDSNDKFIFLYVGQIEKHKGMELLVEAFNDLNNNSQLWIVGDGNHKLQITSNKTDDVKLLRKKSSTEVQKLMREADCLIVPSLCYENQPTVIFEAMQNNLPVIGSDIGGIPELLDEKFLFKAGDSKDLVDKMRWVINNKDELGKLADNTRLKVKDLSVENYIDKILSL